MYEEEEAAAEGGKQKRQSLYTMNQFEAQVHMLTNTERTNMGLRPLYASRILVGVARAHSQDMLNKVPLTSH